MPFVGFEQVAVSNSVLSVSSFTVPANATHVFSTFSYITAFQNLEIAKGVSISLLIIPVSLLFMFFTMKFIFSSED